MTAQTKQEELLTRIHKLFGDEQVYDGGYHSLYDGKWIDMTNEVVSVSEFINKEVLSVLEELESNITLNIKAASVLGTTKVPSKLVIKSPRSTMESLQSIKNRYKL